MRPRGAMHLHPLDGKVVARDVGFVEHQQQWQPGLVQYAARLWNIKSTAVTSHKWARQRVTCSSRISGTAQVTAKTRANDILGLDVISTIPMSRPTRLQHVAHEDLRLNAARRVDHVGHHGGEAGSKGFRDDGAAGGPGEDLDLPRGVRHDVPRLRLPWLFAQPYDLRVRQMRVIAQACGDCEMSTDT